MSTPRLWFSKRYADRVAKLRVPFGFLLAAAFAWLSHPARASLLIGFPVSLLGLALRAWAAGHLAKNRTLARSGPYRHIRNPLYLGTLLVACGLVIAGRSAALAVIFAAVFLLIYLPVIELEEQHLRDLFATSYEEFAARVPALIPRLGTLLGRLRQGMHPDGSNQRFQTALYVKNREYQALLGFLAGAAFLIGKLILSP